MPSEQSVDDTDQFGSETERPRLFSPPGRGQILAVLVIVVLIGFERIRMWLNRVMPR